MDDDEHRPLPFSLDWLAEAANAVPQLTVCPQGHLRVRDRSCWAPSHFSPDLHALWCTPVDHQAGGDR